MARYTVTVDIPIEVEDEATAIARITSLLADHGAPVASITAKKDEPEESPAEDDPAEDNPEEAEDG
jgi:glycine cleavage system regulatory protein